MPPPTQNTLGSTSNTTLGVGDGDGTIHKPSDTKNHNETNSILTRFKKKKAIIATRQRQQRQQLGLSAEPPARNQNHHQGGGGGCDTTVGTTMEGKPLLLNHPASVVVVGEETQDDDCTSRRVPLPKLSEGAQKLGCLLLVICSIIVLVVTLFVTDRLSNGHTTSMSMDGDDGDFNGHLMNGGGGDNSGPTTLSSTGGELNIFGEQYQIALNILIKKNISTSTNLPYGCFNIRCNNINPPTKITIYHQALDQCVFRAGLLGDSLTNFVFEVGPSVDPIAVVQCYAISLLGLSLGVKGWIENDGWVDLNDNECTWYGITCNEEGQVTIIDLPNNNLNGTLPGRELFQLEKLEELKLYMNTIDGDLMEIGACETLRKLWLSDTKLLSGTIPTSIGRLSNMVNIYLSNNKLTGSLPSEIGQLSMLESFSVYSNTMTGSIPTEFSKLTNLQRLFLDHNDLTGVLPKLPNLGSLRDFRVDHNRLSGRIPTAFGILANLEVLNLDNNALTGGIPPSWITRNSKLEQFTGQNNSLSGEIPTALFELPQLTFLRLDDNKLNSIIPDTICADPNSNKLKTLDLSNNEHTGVIPNSLEKCTALETLKLSKNKLKGPIPPWIRNLRNLKTLYLDGNNLSGQIPKDFGLTPKLTFVRLQENGINGQINEALCDNVKELLADCPNEVQITCCNRTP